MISHTTDSVSVVLFDTTTDIDININKQLARCSAKEDNNSPPQEEQRDENGREVQFEEPLKKPELPVLKAFFDVFVAYAAGPFNFAVSRLKKWLVEY